MQKEQMILYLNIVEKEIGSEREEMWRERSKSQAGGSGVEEKFRKAMLGRTGEVYTDMTWGFVVFSFFFYSFLRTVEKERVVGLWRHLNA